MTDSHWYQMLEQSPQEACHALIETYGNLVYAIVLNKLGNVAEREDIEDCVSDVFVKLLQNTDLLSEKNGTLKSYISAVAKHTAIDAYRMLTYRQRMTSPIEENTGPEPISPDNPEKEAEQNLMQQQLWQMIRSLGEPDTSIIIFQYFYGKTAHEIAKQLSMSTAAVQKRSLRIRKKLRKQLEK